MAMLPIRQLILRGGPDGNGEVRLEKLPARSYPKRSSDPDGEVSRRDRRGREVYWEGGEVTSIGSVDPQQSDRSATVRFILIPPNVAAELVRNCNTVHLVSYVRTHHAFSIPPIRPQACAELFDDPALGQKARTQRNGTYTYTMIGETAYGYVGGWRSSDPSDPSIVIRPIRDPTEIVGIGIGIDFCSGWHLALTDPSNCTAELCQHRNNTVPAPGFVRPNPITRSFDTDTDSDPDPDPDPELLASPLTFSDDL